ncbi:hypothetical protein [Streptomyces decoyicus]|uniref:hypothetical protein n=1 Tax=Streptomyces decoyicus TaxID=249567 RepID=UPI0033B50CCA
MNDPNPLYADACENCMTRDVLPQSALRDGAEAIVAGYRCPNCRHTWTCSWGVVPGRALPPEPIDQSLFDRYATAQLHEQAAVNRARKHLSRKDPS